jgi:SNF family Na+-dependent transporter
MTPLLAFLTLVGLMILWLGFRIGYASTKQRAQEPRTQDRTRRSAVLGVLGLGVAVALLITVARGWSILLVAPLLVTSVLVLAIGVWQRQARDDV